MCISESPFASGELFPQDRWALFLDLDGTLIDIVDQPASASVPPRLVGDLLALEQRLNGALAIVSGRPIADVDRLMQSAQFDVAGIHGAEIRIGDQIFREPNGGTEALRRAGDCLARLLSVDAGCVLEDKGVAVAIHWRQAPHLEQVMLDHVLEVASGLGSAYRVQRGKSVAEIVPAMVGKGRAIDIMMALTPYRGCRPIYVGDDLTDEPALELVRARGGISVHVGVGRSSAEYRLDNPAMLRDRVMSWAAGAEIFPAQDFST